MKRPTRAFVLGAGLGTRLRPLTDNLPKPLVPIFNKPLATFALDHLIASGIERFVINTHHRPEAYTRIIGGRGDRADYRGRSVEFRHEPVLLETGGGIKNAQDLLGDGAFILYNGDVLADLPLDQLIEAHCRSENIATLALRSSGAEKRIQCDPASGSITDLRGLLGGRDEPAFVFTGISVFSPEIHKHIPGGEPISIIPVLADLLRDGAPIGGVILDEGLWFDIGTPEAYLDIHRLLLQGRHAFSYLPGDWLQPVAPDATIAVDAELLGCTAVGPGARVQSGARLMDTIVWADTAVPAGADLCRTILASDFTRHCTPPIPTS
jgi:NDP-sugar pyrophosphorylase family protein